MNTPHIRRSYLAGCFVIALAVSVGAGQEPQTFTPRVGQPGKDVVWVPTAEALVNKMLDMAQVTAKDYVIDLGSGDGRTVIAAAKRGAHAMGIEYNPDMVDLSTQNAIAAGVTDLATFKKADIFETSFSQATVVTMFLLPDINLRLRSKILDMKPGTRVVSNSFDMGDWEADATATVDDQNCESWCRALLWIVPAKVGGAWRLPDGDLTFAQNYQMVSGTLKIGGSSTPIVNGRLRGDEITFTAGTAQYTGRVNGNSVSGIVMSGGNNGSWSATRVK